MSNPIEFTIRGTVDWCKLLGPARKYDGDPRFDKGNYWSIEINPDENSRIKLDTYNLGDKLKKDKKKKMDGTERKNVRPYDYLRLTVLENRADGKKNDQPRVEDSYGRTWNQDVEIGNNSVVDILVRFVDYGTTQGLYFKKMRVLKLVEFERTGSDFEPLTPDDEYFASGSEQFARLPDGMEPAEEELNDDYPE